MNIKELGHRQSIADLILKSYEINIINPNNTYFKLLPEHCLSSDIEVLELKREVIINPLDYLEEIYLLDNNDYFNMKFVYILYFILPVLEKHQYKKVFLKIEDVILHNQIGDQISLGRITLYKE